MRAWPPPLVAPEAVAGASAAAGRGGAAGRGVPCSGRAGGSEMASRLAKEQAALDVARASRCSADADQGRSRGAGSVARARRRKRAASRRCFRRYTLRRVSRRRLARRSRMTSQAPTAGGEAATAARFWVESAGVRRRHSSSAGRPPAGRSGDSSRRRSSRSLAYAGWVESEEAGSGYQRSLVPGQRLVDRQGRLWRWDGFTALAAGPSPAAEYLRHRNRLLVLEREITAARGGRPAAEQSAAEARARAPAGDRGR